MAETNGGGMGSGAEAYRPRHAAEQLDDGLMEVLADAADQYRYRQLYEQYDAEFAIARARLFGGGKAEVIAAQQQRIAEAIGRQAAAKAYADDLRAQLYYAPADGVYYQGRHRQEDRGVEEEQPAAAPAQPAEPAQERWTSREVVAPAPAPQPPIETPESGGRFVELPRQGRLRHIIDDEESPAPSLPQAAGRQGEEEPGVALPVQKERRGVLERMRHAWYAGMTAVTGWFMHPEKGKRRRDIVRTAAIVGGVATVFAAAILSNDRAPDYAPQPPIAEPAGPPPNTKHFFDVLVPNNYHGEPFEWATAANQVGAPEATPSLQRLIGYARDNGLAVETWGDPKTGRWGITSVTVDLPDGCAKTYYDTPRKLAILQWYAGGAGPPAGS